MKYAYCEGGLNPLIIMFLTACLISKSHYEKVILICELKNDWTGIFSKFLLYVQISVSSLTVINTFKFIQTDSEPESCLSNLAGLVVLNEFDNIIGNVFEIRVKMLLPKLSMVDDILKDQYHIRSQKVAEAYVKLFMIQVLIFGIAYTVYKNNGCQYFEFIWQNHYIELKNEHPSQSLKV